MLRRIWGKGNPPNTISKSVNWCILWKRVWRFLKNSRLALPHGLAIPLLGIYAKNTKMPSQKNIRIPVFTAALLTIAKIRGKKSKCPSMHEWIKM